MADFNPNEDYNSAYNALQSRIRNAYAGQRANLNQELATRGVQGSGVASIPSSELGAREAGELSGAASNIALAQAQTKVQDRQRLEDFNRQMNMMQYGQDLQNTLQRRLSQNQLAGQIGGGLLGAVGSYYLGRGGKGV